MQTCLSGWVGIFKSLWVSNIQGIVIGTAVKMEKQGAPIFAPCPSKPREAFWKSGGSFHEVLSIASVAGYVASFCMHTCAHQNPRNIYWTSATCQPLCEGCNGEQDTHHSLL